MNDLARIVGRLLRRYGFRFRPDVRLWQCFPFFERVAFELDFLVVRGHPGQRRQRQPQPHGRIAGNEKQVSTLERPGAGTPAQCNRFTLDAGARNRLEGEYTTDRLPQVTGNQADDAASFVLIFQIGAAQIEILRPARLLVDDIDDIFISIDHVTRVQPKMDRQYIEKSGRIAALAPAGRIAVVKQARLAPQRLTVSAPIAAQRPARQRLSRIPLALAEMQQRTRCKALLQAFEQLLRQCAFFRRQGGDVPFRAFHVVNRNEGGLATHGELHIMFFEFLVDAVAEIKDALPLRLAIRLGDARVFVDARHRHGKIHMRFTLSGGADHRRRRRRRRGTGQRDMTLAGEKPRRRIETDPARARNINFGPRVQIGEVLFRPGRAVECFKVGGKLDQIAGSEARSQAKMAQRLHQQPGRVATRTERRFQRLFRCLYAVLHAHDVPNIALGAAIECHQKINGAHSGL